MSTVKTPAIVLFEDDADIAELISLILKSEGIYVHHRPTVEECIDTVRNEKPSLVLMDYMIPGGGGDKAVLKIRAEDDLAKLPILMISAAPDIENIARNVGANGVIKKPFDLNGFTAMVKSCLAA